MKLEIEVDGRRYEVDVDVVDEGGSRAAPARSTSPAIPPPPMPPRPAPRRESTAAPEGDPGKACRSPIAGLVVRVLVGVGQEVAANDPLVVLEAMKMESTITAPHAGKVERIDVAPGDAVTAGKVLLEVA
jgi:methylmalonyl-CoA carboxyltransferase small subunit